MVWYRDNIKIRHKSVKQETLELLSEFMDGEGHRDAGRFMAKRLVADESLQASWSRYHLVRDCIRNRGQALAAAGLNDKVSAVLAQDDVAAANTVRGMPGWVKSLAGGAVAASVMLTAIWYVQSNETPTADGVAVQEPADFVTPGSPLGAAMTPAPRPVSQGSVGQAPLATDSRNRTSRLNEYLLRHNQAVAGNGRGGFVFLVPIVSSQNAAATNEAADMERNDAAANDKEPDAPTSEEGAPDYR